MGFLWRLSTLIKGPGIKNLSIVKVTKIKNLAILKVTKTKKLSILNSPWSVSDHCLIVLEGGGVMMGKVPFKFENMWLKAVGFKDLGSCWVSAYSSYCLAIKLKALKKDLKV